MDQIGEFALAEVLLVFSTLAFVIQIVRWSLEFRSKVARVALRSIVAVLVVLMNGFFGLVTYRIKASKPWSNIWFEQSAVVVEPSTKMAVFSGERHKPGAKVHGIPWDAQLMDVWITISNKSGVDYQDFSMSVESIAMEKQQQDVFLGFYEIAQVSGSVECRTQRDGYFFSFTVAPREGEPVGRPIDGTNLNTTTKKVRADCSRFPNDTHLIFLVAVKNVSRFPGTKIKPAAALAELRYKAKGIDHRKSDFVDIRDMGSVKVKRSEQELARLRSQLLPGKASAITEGPGKSKLMIMDADN